LAQPWLTTSVSFAIFNHVLYYKKMHDVMTKAKCIVDYKFFTKSIRGVAKNHCISKSTVHRWVLADNAASSVLQKRKAYKKRKHAAKKDVLKFIESTIVARPFILQWKILLRCFTNNVVSVFQAARLAGLRKKLTSPTKKQSHLLIMLTTTFKYNDILQSI
jgi:hypothetical protein